MSTGLGMEALWVAKIDCTIAAVSSSEPMTPPCKAGMIGLPMSLDANGISSTTRSASIRAASPSQAQYGTAAINALMSGATPSRAARARSSIASGFRLGGGAHLGQHEGARRHGDGFVRRSLIGAAARKDDLARDLDA